MCTDNQEDIQNKKIEGLTDLSVEILPARINPNKPHCPKCHVTVTDIGTCPYCETIVINKWKPAPTKEKYEIISKKGLNKKETVAFKKVDNSFFNQFALTNFNFDVQIHRKVGGPVKYQTYPKLQTELNELEKGVCNRKGKALYTIKKSQPCECGCTSDIIDLHHGEVLCPTCGKVHEVLFIVDGKETHL